MTICGKIAYPTKVMADSAIRTIHHAPTARNTKPIRAYFCKVCNAWHITKEKTFNVDRKRDVRPDKNMMTILRKQWR